MTSTTHRSLARRSSLVVSPVEARIIAQLRQLAPRSRRILRVVIGDFVRARAADSSPAKDPKP